MAGYQKLNILLKEELDAFYEEGFDIDKKALTAEIDVAGDDKAKLMSIYSKLLSAKMRNDYKYEEPSDYESIVKASEGGNNIIKVGTDFDRFYGAWLGRCIGNALGIPVELWHYSVIRTWFEKAGKYPINGYVPTHSRAEAEDNMRVGGSVVTDENISYMVTDDDIRYTVLGLMLTDRLGSSFDTYDVGANWVYNLPFRALCTAENQAYLNFSNVDEFGPWGKPDNAMSYFEKNKVNTYLNPYREWIGAQIRIDAYGYAAAGNPHLAAKMAYTDAYLSHTKNGIYGAMFFAALIAAAFVGKDIDVCIKAAAAEIPLKSRFYEMIDKAVYIGRNSSSPEQVVAEVNALYPEYNYVHTINNAAICIASLVYSKGDFNKAVGLSVMCGMDTDCNGATVGSVMGAFCGEKGIADHWKLPLNDTLYSGLTVYNPVKISDIARKSMEIQQRIQIKE
ncbi:MAG: ADP-ribosylglycohydrolase family protein [Clostridia bacterium]|nr:ADP-ribosylglycohydrolase family protein [Clostridia bacterium]